jgi:uncharacterized protein (DUF3084 family)
MSDQNSFINTYIDLAMGTIHENTNAILQLKTREKLANDLLLEKDRIISDLTEQLKTQLGQVQSTSDEEIARLTNELAAARAEHASVKTEYETFKTSKNQETAKMNGHTADLESERQTLLQQNQTLLGRVQALESEQVTLTGKASHLETALNQVHTMKQDIIAKNAEIATLKKTIAELQTPPKEVPKEAINTKRKKNVVVIKEEELNDF